MLKWTTEMRYRPYEKWDSAYLQKLMTTKKNSIWHMNYHIQPTSGLLNDPNGFSYFNGRWHLFYQFYPFGPVHGLKSWYHLSSTNLLDWEEHGYGLLPDTPFDSHGVYSGTALPIDDKLLLAYTGNVRDKNGERASYQMGAWMDTDQQIEKIDTPLIPTPPKGYTHHFRDPQVIPYDNGYLLFIGAQTEQETGEVLVYQSENLTDWSLLGPLDFTKDAMGYMIECPNMLFIDEQPVLIFCPQGMEKSVTPYDNIYPNMVVVGEAFDSETQTIVQPKALQNLDHGFDLYATQAFQAPDGRVLSIGWAGLPEIAYPTDAEDWAHCLTLVRELSLKEGHLYQKPTGEHIDLRQKEQQLKGNLQKLHTLVDNPQQNSYELELTITKNSQGSLHLFADAENKHSLALHFDSKHGKITLDRSQVSLPFAEEFGSTRSISLEKETTLKLQIFVDQSICEIFVNDGHSVFTSRVFPKIEETQLFIEGNQGSYEGHYWELRSTSQN